MGAGWVSRTCPKVPRPCTPSAASPVEGHGNEGAVPGMRIGVVSRCQGGLGHGPQPLHRRPDPEGKDKQDHKAHREASCHARRAVGSHDLAVRLARRWQSAPKLSQSLFSGPAEPVPSGMGRTSSFAGQVASDHRLALYGHPTSAPSRLRQDQRPARAGIREDSPSATANHGLRTPMARVRPRSPLERAGARTSERARRASGSSDGRDRRTHPRPDRIGESARAESRTMAFQY